MDANARPIIVNLKTGTRTPMRVVWTADMDANERGMKDVYINGNPVEQDDEPDTCRYCTATTPADVDDDDWACDDCTERLAMADWMSRSDEAQDRAVMRGMG